MGGWNEEEGMEGKGRGGRGGREREKGGISSSGGQWMDGWMDG